MKFGHCSNQGILVVTACLVFGSQPVHGVAGDIINLGTLGGSLSYAHSINASGQVTGDSLLPDDFTTRAYRYSGTPGSGTMVDLGTLGGTHSIGSAINASGQVAGQSDTAGNVAVHAFRYTGTPGIDGVMHDLGTLAGTEFPFGSSHAFAINDAGQVAGMSSGPGGIGIHAFRYTGTPGVDGLMEDLGTLGGSFSQGYAINAAGQVAGFSGTSGDAGTHAFLYTGTPGIDGLMADLGTLGGSGSGGHAMNAAGHVVGTSDLAGNAVSHAFLYTGTPGNGGAMADLGTLGGSYSAAWGINSLDQVVGESYITGDAARRAFLYIGTPGVDGVMIDLNAWLDAVIPTEGAKWSLHVATGISDAGLITGNGYYDDGPGGLDDGFRGYILDASGFAVPEPSSIVLAMSGLIGVLLGTCRRLEGNAERHVLLCASLGLILLAAIAVPARADVLYAADSGRINRIASDGTSSLFANSLGSADLKGIAFDSAGNLYAANYADSTIEKFTPDGVGSIFASTGLSLPEGLAFDRAGNLYVGNQGTNTIEKFTPDGVGSTFASMGPNAPTGMAFDSAGNLYVATPNDTIEKFTPDGVHTLFATSHIHNPSALAFDSAGDLYVAHSTSVFNIVVKVTPSGAVSSFAVGAVSFGLAFDSTGTLLATDYFHSAIIGYSTEDGASSVFASNGAMSLPTGLAITDDAGIPLPLANQVPEPATSVLAMVAALGLLGFTSARRIRRATKRPGAGYGHRMT